MKIYIVKSRTFFDDYYWIDSLYLSRENAEKREKRLHQKASEDDFLTTMIIEKEVKDCKNGTFVPIKKK